MLIRTNNWKEFSNHDPSHGSANSLEKVDGNVHVLTGGAGQMADPTVTGQFAPLLFRDLEKVDLSSQKVSILSSSTIMPTWIGCCHCGPHFIPEYGSAHVMLVVEHGPCPIARLLMIIRVREIEIT